MRQVDGVTDEAVEGTRLVVARDWSGVVSTALGALGGQRPDPFVLPLLVVPSRAHARALAQQVARQHGVAAGLEGTTPSRLRTDLERSMLGLDPRTDPWRADALALRIAAVLEDGDRPWLADVDRYVDRMSTAGVRSPAWDLSARTAGFLLRLARRWPEVLRAWADGRDVALADAPLDPAHRWWAPLWRELISRPSTHPQPLERHRMLVEALGSADGRRPEWSRCLWVTAAATDPVDRDLAVALSGAVPTTVVHLDHAARYGSDAWSTFDRTRPAATRAWRDAVAAEVPTAARDDATATLLDRVRTAGDGGEAGPASADGTLVIHDCHGPDRQAEVIRDALCEALADMPDLEPRDLLVVCPVHSPLPHLLAGLTCPTDPGTASWQHPGRGIRVGAPAEEPPNPVAVALLRALRLGSARATAADLVDLCGLPAVSARFGFSSDDLATIARLVEDAGVRWGIDASARSRAGLPDVRQSTWLAGVERMLLGIAMSSSPPAWLSTVTPVEGIGSADVDVVGRLAELVSRLRRALADTSTPVTLARWGDRLARMVDELTASPGQPWAGPATVGAVTGLAGSCPDTIVDRDRVMSLVAARTRGHSHPAWFGGTVLVCTPADLDGIDHAVVVLADPDGSGAPDEPMPGLRRADDPERDAAAVDRQLVVDAISSARRRLVVVRQALDPSTNSPVMPGPFSITLEAAVAAVGVDPAQVTVHHGLQPFSPSEYPISGGCSFDPAMSAHTAAGADPRPALMPAPRQVGGGVYSPAELASVLTAPARALLRNRLGTDTRSWAREPADDLPVELDALAGYGVRSRILADLLSGAAPADALTAERLRGSTPPGDLGIGPLRAQADRAAAIVAAAGRARAAGPARSVPVDLALVGGAVAPLRFAPNALTDPDRPLRLQGRVGVWGDTVVRSSASRASARDLLGLWIDLLSVGASAPGHWRGVLACDSRARVLVCPGSPRCEELLAGLARTAWWAAQQLVPLPLRTAAVQAGLLRGPAADRRTGRSGLDIQWGRERDSDWAAFIGPDADDWAAACTVLGTSAQELSAWLFEPLMAADAGGTL